MEEKQYNKPHPQKQFEHNVNNTRLDKFLRWFLSLSKNPLAHQETYDKYENTTGPLKGKHD